MAKLATSRYGRIALHLLALLGDGALRFHAAGIRRELHVEE
jgi:hypothetical protein